MCFSVDSRQIIKIRRWLGGCLKCDDSMPTINLTALLYIVTGNVRTSVFVWDIGEDLCNSSFKKRKHEAKNKQTCIH